MRPEPTAEGSFSKTPFAHVLVYMRERSLTGTLAVQCEGEAPELEGETLVAIEAGALAQARQPRVTDPLGFVLREMNAITDEQLNESLSHVAAKQGLQGEILIAMGACTPELVERGLRAQLRRKAIRLFGAARASYQFFEGLDLLADFGRERQHEDVFSVLWRGVRAFPNARMIDGVVDRVGSSHLRLRAGADLRAFGFDKSEQGPIDVLRVGATPVDGFVRAASDPRVGRAMAYVLLIAKQLETVAASAPRTSVTAPPPTGPSSKPFGETSIRGTTAPRAAVSSPAPRGDPPAVDAVPAEYRERLAEVQKRAVEIEDENYFQMLGVPIAASSDAVREAFLAAAAKWHPDRSPPHPALRELYAKVFAYLTEAQETLSNDEARARYLSSVQDGGGTPNAQRKIAALIEAATDAQKAEICLRRREFDEAERLARQALRVSPDDPNALVVLATALVEKQADPMSPEPVKVLTRVIEIAPKNDRAHLLLGGIYKRRGNLVKALEHFELAVASNPKNVEATREVRLAEMRGRSGASPAATPGGEKGGLFSKLLKR